MLGQKAVELAVKHIVAKSTKQFFGYGPAEKVAVVIQGDLVIFATRFSGPGILDALPKDPFGRLAMRHIADLFTREVTPELVRLARDEFGVGLRALCNDLDFETGQSLGIAMLDQPLQPADFPAGSELTRIVAAALADATGAIGAPALSPLAVRIGPAALVVRAPNVAFPEGVTAEEEFAALKAREIFRAHVRAGLSAGLASRRMHAGPCFVVNSPTGMVAGTLASPHPT